MWNLLPFDFIDITFILIMTYFVFSFLKYPIRMNKSICTETVCILLLILFGIIQLVYALFAIKQSAFESFLTVREILYIAVALPIAFYTEVESNIIRFIVKLEIIGSTLYILTALLGRPLSPIAYFSGSSVLVGGIDFYRDFCPIPFMAMFIVPFLTIGIINKKYLWNRKKDMMTVALIVITMAMHLFRTRLLIVLAEIVGVGFFSLEQKKRKKIWKKTQRVILIIVVVGIAFMIVPAIRNRFIEGWNDISYAFSGAELNPYNGTFTYRMWLFSFRIKYLVTNDKLWFGMGAISSRNTTAFFGNGKLGTGMSEIYNPDNAYMTLLPRYGVIGTTFYIMILLVLAYRCIKKKTKVSISAGVFILCAIVEGMSGNSALCEYALMIIGLLVGMVMEEKNNKSKLLQ